MVGHRLETVTINTAENAEVLRYGIHILMTFMVYSDELKMFNILDT